MITSQPIRGSPETGRGGGAVLLSPDKASVYYQGTLNDKNPEQVGPKTFVDRVVIKNGEKKRLFESDNNGVYESVSTVLDPEASRFIIERQSPTAPAQFFLLEGGTRKQLTENRDLFPDLTSAPKMRVPVERADGIKFSVSVMLPFRMKKLTLFVTPGRDPVLTRSFLAVSMLIREDFPTFERPMNANSGYGSAGNESAEKTLFRKRTSLTFMVWSAPSVRRHRPRNILFSVPFRRNPQRGRSPGRR